MKVFQFPTVFCFATALLLAIGHAEVSPIRVRVEVTSKTDADRAKDKDTTTYSRLLNVIVDNGGAEAAELKVKYAIFGRDVESRDIVTLGMGELPVSVKARGTEKVQTPKADATVEEVKKAPKGEKKPDPTGKKIVGHGVQILKGDTVVAEAYEPASMKTEFTSAKAPKPAAAKK
jgi:hypothetical protein